MGHTSVALAAAAARVSPNSWLSIETGTFQVPMGDEISLKRKLGAIGTAHRILSYFITKVKGRRQFNLSDCFEILGFDLHDPDVQAAVRRTADSTLEPDVWALLSKGQLKVGLSGWPPFSSDSTASLSETDAPGSKTAGASASPDATSSPGKELVTAILRGAAGQPEAATEQVGLDFTSYTELGEAINALAEGKEAVVFGIYDTPPRRFMEMAAVNLPGLSFSLGLLCSNDINTSSGEGWRPFIDLIASEQREFDLFAVKHEVGFEFLVGQCNIPQNQVQAPAEFTIQGIADLMSRARLKNRRVALVADAAICEKVQGQIASAAVSADDRRLLSLQMYTASRLEEFGRSGRRSIPFPVPRYRAAFVVKNGERLIEQLRACLGGEFFPIFSAIMARQYAHFLSKTMFLRRGQQHIILEPFPPDISRMDQVLFAHACLAFLDGGLVQSGGAELSAIRDEIRRVWIDQNYVLPAFDMNLHPGKEAGDAAPE